tara:strand:+ start:94 stop:468 length:375 start_codon:yes stop_codon:yes gene_type:complete
MGSNPKNTVVVRGQLNALYYACADLQGRASANREARARLARQMEALEDEARFIIDDWRLKFTFGTILHETQHSVESDVVVMDGDKGSHLIDYGAFYHYDDDIERYDFSRGRGDGRHAGAATTRR